jgi:DNA modification methylase
MKTRHQIIFQDSKNMKGVDSESVDLVVTSPPYPMIEMWDEMFVAQNGAISKALSKEKGQDAFELMHQDLDTVWNEVDRILRKGGIACINIGDATRTIDGNFVLYQNHARILTYLLKIGFSSLPAILWRKQTNAPNKFMGSGMLPPGAYVTLEHEFILILRKGSMRQFKTARETQIRRESAFFWEERNVWYSDIWLDLKGTAQSLNYEQMRLRSAAYPFELPYRLINMFSVKGDTVLDPFLGTGTTTLAAMAAGRNSVGFEIEPSFRKPFVSQMDTIVPFSNQQIRNRIKNHIGFVKDRYETKGAFKHMNKHYGFPVVTSQEEELLLNQLVSTAQINDGVFEVSYSDKPQEEFCGDWEEFIIPAGVKRVAKKRMSKRTSDKMVQLTLLDN